MHRNNEDSSETSNNKNTQFHFWEYINRYSAYVPYKGSTIYTVTFIYKLKQKNFWKKINQLYFASGLVHIWNGAHKISHYRHFNHHLKNFYASAGP